MVIDAADLMWILLSVYKSDKLVEMSALIWWKWELVFILIIIIRGCMRKNSDGLLIEYCMY